MAEGLLLFITTLLIITSFTLADRDRNVKSQRRFLFFDLPYPDYDYDDNTTQSPIEDCECGLSNEPKIVGGDDANMNEYPWMVYMLVRTLTGSFFCGGSLLTDRHVLTAAHCATPGILGRVTVVLGDHDRSTSNETESIVRRVSTIRIHPRYNIPSPNNYDMAVLTLENPITFARNVRPICLPNAVVDYTGSLTTVTGWGRTTEGGSSSNILQEADLKVVSLSQCRRAYRGVIGARITAQMICAGATQDGSSDACQGDSGGPLMIIRNNQMNVIGVVSFGAGCARPGIPGVYARVDRSLTWIREQTKDGVSCP